jgi:hypothetical protein
MDKNTLVSSGHALVRAMDATGFSPRFAMWVHNNDTDTWKLWLVPPVGHKDKLDFYRRIANIVSTHHAELGGLSASDTEMIPDSHPTLSGLKRFIRMPGLGSASLTANLFNGYLLPDGIVLRSNL